MILNISKIKTEALLLICKDLLNSYENISDDNIFEVNEEIKEFMDKTSSDLLKQLRNLTRDNSFYLENKSSYRVNAILKSYNYLNQSLNQEFKEGMVFNPALLCFSMLAMWFKELNKESNSKEYIFFLLYPFGNVYDKLFVKVEDEKFKAINLKMIEIAEKVMIKYDRVKIN